MAAIETELKRWGNSIGIIIPSEIVEQEQLKEKHKVRVILLKESKVALSSSFGLLKNKIHKSAQQIKDELRRDLYN